MNRLRRAILGTLALAAFAAPPIASGCGAGFAPISEIDGLRVLAVVADKPYANPGEEVHFTLTYDDGYQNPTNPDAGPRTIEILWIAGCFDPAGDEYYGCYEQLAGIFKSFNPSSLPPGLVGAGETFTLTLPTDIISRRPKPPSGTPYYGIAYVFFLACAGTLKPVPPQGDGLAGSFPVGCFDEAGNQLDATSYVPGYTTVYAFADGRTNANPVVNGLAITQDGTNVSITDAGAGADASTIDAGADAAAPGTVPPCSIAEGDRSGGGCGHTDPFSACTDYIVQVEVPNDVAELDPATKDANGNPLHEEVWVDYFADQGDLQDPILLVSDATLGIQNDYSTKWIPPPSAATANLWAVVHDSRGGETVVHRQIVVK